HLINIFERRRTDEWRHKMRKFLQCLDESYPELVKEANWLGMKSFGQLELYPDKDRGFRLPLARSRTVLLDKPLTPVLHRKIQQQDVAGYISWLQQPNKVFMPVEDVLTFVVETVKEQPNKKAGNERNDWRNTVKSGVGDD